ncbi:MAG: hypothetical protein R2861_15875 [Desulfobacterales bacterium]
MEYDELVGDLVEEQTDVDQYASVKKVEAMSPKTNGIILKISWPPAFVAMPAEMLSAVLLPHLLCG